jgi:hypothetical protein
MWQDEILDEIHKFREEHAKSFNYDLDTMLADWHQKQGKSGRKVVSFSRKVSREISTGSSTLNEH